MSRSSLQSGRKSRVSGIPLDDPSLRPPQRAPNRSQSPTGIGQPALLAVGRVAPGVSSGAPGGVGPGPGGGGLRRFPLEPPAEGWDEAQHRLKGRGKKNLELKEKSWQAELRESLDPEAADGEGKWQYFTKEGEKEALSWGVEGIADRAGNRVEEYEFRRSLESPLIGSRSDDAYANLALRKSQVSSPSKNNIGSQHPMRSSGRFSNARQSSGRNSYQWQSNGHRVRSSKKSKGGDSSAVDSQKLIPKVPEPTRKTNSRPPPPGVSFLSVGSRGPADHAEILRLEALLRDIRASTSAATEAATSAAALFGVPLNPEEEEEEGAGVPVFPVSLRNKKGPQAERARAPQLEAEVRRLKKMLAASESAASYLRRQLRTRNQATKERMGHPSLRSRSGEGSGGGGGGGGNSNNEDDESEVQWLSATEGSAELQASISLSSLPNEYSTLSLPSLQSGPSVEIMMAINGEQMSRTIRDVKQKVMVQMSKHPSLDPFGPDLDYLKREIQEGQGKLVAQTAEAHKLMTAGAATWRELGQVSASDKQRLKDLACSPRMVVDSLFLGFDRELALLFDTGGVEDGGLRAMLETARQVVIRRVALMETQVAKEISRHDLDLIVFVRRLHYKLEEVLETFLPKFIATLEGSRPKQVEGNAAESVAGKGDLENIEKDLEDLGKEIENLDQDLGGGVQDSTEKVAVQTSNEDSEFTVQVSILLAELEEIVSALLRRIPGAVAFAVWNAQDEDEEQHESIRQTVQAIPSKLESTAVDFLRALTESLAVSDSQSSDPSRSSSSRRALIRRSIFKLRCLVSGWRATLAEAIAMTHQCSTGTTESTKSGLTMTMTTMVVVEVVWSLAVECGRAAELTLQLGAAECRLRIKRAEKGGARRGRGGRGLGGGEGDEDEDEVEGDALDSTSVAELVEISAQRTVATIRSLHWNIQRLISAPPEEEGSDSDDESSPAVRLRTRALSKAEVVRIHDGLKVAEDLVCVVEEQLDDDLADWIEYATEHQTEETVAQARRLRNEVSDRMRPVTHAIDSLHEFCKTHICPGSIISLQPLSPICAPTGTF